MSCNGGKIITSGYVIANSNIVSKAEFVFFIPMDGQLHIIAELFSRKSIVQSDKLNASSFGSTTALRIEVAGDAQIGQYVIPILVNMSTA